MSRTVIKATVRQVPKAQPSTAKTALHKNLDYSRSRENRHGQTQDRVAYTRDESSIGHEQGESMINEPNGRYAYTMVISPDPNNRMTDQQLTEYARSVMGEIERTHGNTNWIAVNHTDQESKSLEHPHSHLAFHADAKLTRHELERLREFGDQEQTRILERDLTRYQEPNEPSIDRALEQAQERNLEQGRPHHDQGLEMGR
jgi:hypothetical protein